jgi:hypothetical protein
MDKTVSPDLFKHVQPSKTHVVDVVVSSATLNDLDQMNAIVKGILGAHGCTACCSGLDIRFRDEAEVVLYARGGGALTATTYKSLLTT